MLTTNIGVLSLDQVQYGNHFPASNTDAIVTVPSVLSRNTIIHSIQWSYSGVPTGRLTVVADGITVLDVDITAAGPGGFQGAWSGVALVVKLFAGGVGVTGKLNVQSAD